MKKLFVPVLAVLSLLLASCGSTKIVAPYSSQKIIEVANTSKADLYDKANIVAAEMFAEASGSKITYADKDAGLMQGKFALSEIRSGPYFHVANTIVTIEVKEGKIRITFTDFTRTYSVDAKKASYKQKEKGLDLSVKTTLDEDFTSKMDLDVELENFVATFIAKMGLEDW